MAAYTADVAWSLREGEDFAKGRYSRGHVISFDGGLIVPASASPHVVGKWAVQEAVDPEEMFVAALSNCHMLTFLHKARLAGFVVTSYRDHASGIMEEIAPGKMAVTKVTLSPHRPTRSSATGSPWSPPSCRARSPPSRRWRGRDRR